MRACSRIFLGTGLAILVAGAAAESVRAEDATQAFESFPSIAGPRKMPKLTGFSPMTTDPIAEGTLKDVKLEALLTEKGAPVEAGLTWRMFSPIPGSDGKLPLLATSEGGSTAFNVAPGDYFVNVSFGRASATRKIRVPQEGTLEKQTLVLDVPFPAHPHRRVQPLLLIEQVLPERVVAVVDVAGRQRDPSQRTLDEGDPVLLVKQPARPLGAEDDNGAVLVGEVPENRA